MQDDVIRIQAPLSPEIVRALRAGNRVALDGIIYTARDAAHQRLSDALQAGDPLPITLEGEAIYYCGPSETPPGKAIGSAGPTTSYRMDAYAPALYALGLKATIGKGDRKETVRAACKEHGAVYLVAIGGAGALLARAVRQARVVAYEDLGPEAIRELTVAGFPAVVAYDCHGGSVFPGDEAL